DGTIGLFDVGTGQEVRRLRGGHDHRVTRLAIAPDGKTIASVDSFDTHICLWDTETGQPLPRPGHRAGVRHLTVSPDGILLASGGRDRVLRMWNLETGKPVRQHSFGRHPVGGLAFSPDGHTLSAGSAGPTAVDNVVRLWDTATGKELRTFGERLGIHAV